ncbi:hypothetical protein Q7P37_009709 [Cladosporium fusiforme]
MAGAEAIAAIQLIDACIGITKTILDIGRAVKDAQGLPPKLRDLCEKLPAIEELLHDAHDSCEKGKVDEDNSRSAKPILKQCEQALAELRDIFWKACPKEKDDCAKRIWQGTKTVFFGRDGRVQKLLVVVQENLRFLEQKEVFRIGDRLDELQQLTEALAQDDHGRFTHTGAGNILANQGGSHTNYLMSGSGRQVNNPGVYNEGPSKDMLTRIQQWLSPPDPHQNLRRSLKLRSADTGKWYLQGTRYEGWKVGGTPFTWLYGSAGAGKTVLSASIVEDMQGYCNVDPARSLAFFFFDFNDAEKQDPINMVKSLLCQFLNRCTSVPDVVRSLHATCENGRREASEEQLLQALRDTLELLPAPFVVLDALDECSSWEVLFDILLEMQGWGKDTLRVLLTSRKEFEIEETLGSTVPPNNRTCLESHLVDKDIGTYVQERLAKDKHFKRWQKDSEMREEIENTLGRKANGMFRWAACQLDALAQCVTRGKVRRALQDLPKTLDETYARILRAIDEGPNAEEALKILTWLAYAERPLTATEVCQVTGIVTGEDCRFDEDEVLEDSNDILRICSSLVSIATAGRGSNESDDDDDDVTYDQSFNDEQGPGAGVMYVRLAHFSVKEYLVSTRPSIERYRLGGQESHDTLATCCLVYLLRFNGDEWQDPDCESVFSFARYASRFWTQHARVSGTCSNQQRDLATEIFVQNSTAFLAWMRFFNINRPWERNPDIRRTLDGLPEPLYVASHEGLAQSVSVILDAGADVNAQGGAYGNALQAASLRGHEKVVHVLLAAGAEVNAQGGAHGNALQAASLGGHEKVVLVLLAAGAEVNAQGGEYGNALQAASLRGHEKVVHVLLAAGAEVNAQGGAHGNALQAASLEGHEKVVQMLLAAGAEVNAQRGGLGNALQAASLRGDEKVVQMLLAAGAEVNTQGGLYGNALQAASFEGHEKVVQMLLAAGAEVNAQGGRFGNALQAASLRGNEKVVHVLLAAGAEVNAQGGHYGNALQAASLEGHEKVVQMLLAAGAEVNAQGGDFGNALQAASLEGHEKVVQVLLAAGAETVETPVA